MVWKNPVLCWCCCGQHQPCVAMFYALSKCYSPKSQTLQPHQILSLVTAPPLAPLLPHLVCQHHFDPYLLKSHTTLHTDFQDTSKLCETSKFDTESCPTLQPIWNPQNQLLPSPLGTAFWAGLRHFGTAVPLSESLLPAGTIHLTLLWSVCTALSLQGSFREEANKSRLGKPQGVAAIKMSLNLLS